MSDKDIHEVIGWLTERYYDPKTCYPCWQVGRENVKPDCVVVWNTGTKYETKKLLACNSCVTEDRATFPAMIRVVATVLTTDAGREASPSASFRPPPRKP